MKRRLAIALVCGLACGITGMAAAPEAPQPSGQQAPPPAKSPYLKLAAPWPDAETLRKRQAEAEGRPLFASMDPLTFTLTADFKAINKDRDPASTRQFPGTLAMTAPGGGALSLDVQIGARGQVRRNPRVCDFVPLRVTFTKAGVKKTVFDGQDSLKLVTHCWQDASFEQYVLRQYLAYRLFSLHTPRSFRARLAIVTYVDTSGGKPVAGRHGIFIEDDDDVARRSGGRSVDIPRSQFKDLDPGATTMMSILQYMIGNTDYSIYALHNVRLLQTPALGRLLIPVVYDFDMAGLVNAHYARADPKLGLASVRDRLYRGPCRTMAELEPVLQAFLARRDGGPRAARDDTRLQPAIPPGHPGVPSGVLRDA